MFDSYWQENYNDIILNKETAKILYDQIILCDKLAGSTAEVGVYEGMTSKLILNALNRSHYCYDTFEGIIDSSQQYGDKHRDGEFVCNIDKVKQNLKSFNVFYKQGRFPETFEESLLSFCFVYSDTATYLGTKHTFEYFKYTIPSGGKIIFYVNDMCSGVINAINECKYDNLFTILHMKNFIIFTKT